jgi:hypothetical protein
MNRRDALNATVALLGSAIIGSQTFLSGCRRSETNVEDFSDDVLTLLDDIGETILPASTESPGARASKIGEFMKTIVTDCYSPGERKTFFEGISIIQKTAKDKYNNSFVKLTDPQKIEMMLSFDQEAQQPLDHREDNDDEVHFFTMLNQLTVWGFFSSEPGATRALRYVPIPGRYEGCVPYKEGDGAWVY